MAINCSQDAKGTGTTSCDISSFGDATGIIPSIRNFSYASMTETLYKEAIKENNVFPLLEIYGFEQNTPENERSTSSTGIMSDIRDGKPQFSFQFTKGGCFHKALYSLRGNSRWDLAIVFQAGILIYKNDTVERGFRNSLFSVETFRLLQGTDPQMSTAVIQLASAEEFNKYHQFITWEELGFNINDINGAVETTLTIGTNSATSIPVRVTGACKTDVSVSGLDAVGNWTVINNSTGAEIEVTSVTESAGGNYTLAGTGFPTTNLTVVLNGEDELDEIYKGSASK